MYFEFNDPFKDINNVMVRLLKYHGYNARLFTPMDPGWESSELCSEFGSYIKLDHPKISLIGLRLMGKKANVPDRDGNYTIDIHYVVPKERMSNPKEYRATLKYITRGFFSKEEAGVEWQGREITRELSGDEPNTTMIAVQLKPHENIVITPDPDHACVHIVLRTKLTIERSHPELLHPYELPSMKMFTGIERVAGKIKDYAT